MVADVHRVLVEGGIFAYPGEVNDPNGKLRLLYEVAPMAMLVEQAQGLALAGPNRVWDLQVSDVHQRSSVGLGSIDAVEEYRTCFGPEGS
jgi:fructose-1,6-bisphosphatase I